MAPTRIVPQMNDAPVLDQVDGYWQKLAAFILWKTSGRNMVRITAEDMQAMEKAFAPGIPVILTHGHTDSLEFSLVTEEAAVRLAEHNKKIRGAA